MPLPRIGRLNYNGYEFNSSTRLASFVGRCIYSEDQRTITDVEFTIEVVTKIVGTLGGSCDAEVNFAMQRLTQPAAGFILTGRGFSNITVNLGGTQDISWGPKPQSVELSSLGPGKAVALKWGMKWRQPTCDSAITTFPPGVREFGFKLDYDIDKSGYTTRVYTGYIVIPQTRLNADAQRASVTADSLRDTITPGQLLGFRRVSCKTSESEDRCRLTVCAVDTQLPPNPPPVGVIEASLVHEIASDPGKGRLLLWNGILEGSYELARGVPVDAAVSAFAIALNDRINRQAFQAVRFAGIPGGGAAGGGGGGGFVVGALGGAGAAVKGAAEVIRAAKGRPDPLVPDTTIGAGVVIPMQFMCRDKDAYDKTTVELRVNYRITAVDLGQILTRGGLWRPLPQPQATVPVNQAKLGKGAAVAVGGVAGALGNAPQTVDIVLDAAFAWQQSVAHCLNPRGFAQLAFDPREDRIADMCSPLNFTVDMTQFTVPKGQQPSAGAPLKFNIVDLKAAGAAANSFDSGLRRVFLNAFPQPTPKNSWLDYHNAVAMEADSGTVAVQTLPTQPITEKNRSPSQAWDATGGAPSPALTSPSIFAALPTADGCSVQRRTKPIIYIRMTGYAERVGFPIPIPELTSVNGVKPTLVSRLDRGEGFIQAQIGAAQAPIYAAAWNLRYVVNDFPTKDGNLKPPPNPLLGT